LIDIDIDIDSVAIVKRDVMKACTRVARES